MKTLISIAIFVIVCVAAYWQGYADGIRDTKKAIDKVIEQKKKELSNETGNPKKD